MSTTPETAPPRPPLRLKTLGTLVLRGAAGDTLWADYGQQGWRLALLAVLAAAGDRGCSRDRLLLLFWPDASQQQARHSLEQLLYKMRKSLSASPFLGVNPLRLDPSVVTSDLGDFETALAVGDPETAIGHYGGPFLDGFYLGDSPEFEEWMIGERSRLEAEHARALERLAQSAATRGDHEAAVAWWRKLFALDSLSGRNAVGLMRALANCGDHAAALRHAEQYERRVAQELGTSAGPEIAALGAEIRAHAREAPQQAVGTSVPSGSAPRAGAPLPSRSPATTPPTPSRVRRSFQIAAGALALAAVVFAFMQFRDTPAGAPAAAALEPSIAVLPLANLSADPGDAALADGMTEELIGVLSRAGNLRVIASTSVFALRDRSLDVRQIADSLSVSHVVEGGLQRVGTRLRMQVRLVDARDGSTLWSETYDREFEDVFAVQEEIARAVARELDVRLAGGGPGPSMVRHHTQSIAAYDYYLRGIDAGFRQHNPPQGAEYFERAIAADSGYAPAYAGLARMIVLRGAGHRDLLSDAEDAAREALTLDDSLAEAHEAMGWVHLVQMDFRSSEADFKRAIALDPRYSHAHEGLAQLYLWLNRPEDQLTEARLALENDPFSHSAIREMARALLVNGRYDDARDRLLPLKELSPPAGYAGLIRGQCFIMEEKWPEAIAELRWAEEHTAGHAPAFLGYALARAGRRDEAGAVLADLLSGKKYSHGAFGIAIVYAGLRDYDQAFAWLNRALEEKTLTRDLMLPIFDDLHRDPRFERVRARLGLEGD